jgi:hypothetical protein
MAARMAMMAITTNNSINVNPRGPGAGTGGAGIFMVSIVSRSFANGQSSTGHKGFHRNYKSKVAVLNTLFRGEWS